MKQADKLHELLVFTGTQFSKKEFCEKEEKEYFIGSTTEKLEKACWSGLVFEMLPEILGGPFQSREIFTWEVLPANHYIRICLGAAPVMPASETCLDPYFFLSTCNSN